MQYVENNKTCIKCSFISCYAAMVLGKDEEQLDGSAKYSSSELSSCTFISYCSIPFSASRSMQNSTRKLLFLLERPGQVDVLWLGR